MAYKVKATQPERRAIGLAHGARGAGLYAEETAVELDDGSFVAVSVVPRWLPNGAGVDFAAVARAIEEDGTAIVCPFGQQVGSTFNFNAGPLLVEELGVDAIAKEVLLAVLGEPPELTRDAPVQGKPPLKVPVLDLSREVKLNVNVRRAAALARASGPKDAKAILGKKAGG
jgi:hypothetical protein